MKSTPGMELDSAMLLCALAHKVDLHAVRHSQSPRDDTSAIAMCSARIAARYARTVVFGIGGPSLRYHHA